MCCSCVDSTTSCCHTLLGSPGQRLSNVWQRTHASAHSISAGEGFQGSCRPVACLLPAIEASLLALIGALNIAERCIFLRPPHTCSKPSACPAQPSIYAQRPSGQLTHHTSSLSEPFNTTTNTCRPVNVPGKRMHHATCATSGRGSGGHLGIIPVVVLMSGHAHGRPHGT
jgi:hypothetical protein